MFQSPFLDANPSYASLLTSAIPPKALLPDGEYVAIVLRNRFGRFTWESSFRPTSIGFGDFSEVPRPKVGYARPFKAWLIVLVIRDGRRYRSYRTVRWIYPKGKNPMVPPHDYGTAMRDARRDLRGKIYLPPGKRTSNQRSSSLRPNPENRVRVRQNFSEGNNGGYFFSPSTSSEVYYTRTWSGTRTPGFGGLKKNQRPVNPHSVSITDVSDAGLIEMIDIPSTGVYFNQYSAFTRRYSGPAAPSHDPGAKQKAIKRLIDKLESGIDSNLAQDIVQIKQTVRLVADTASRLARAGAAAKNGNFPRAASALFGTKSPRYDRKFGPPNRNRQFADNWLAVQYGWKPLLQDLHGAFEAVARLQLADASVKQVKASAQVESWDVNDLPLFIGNKIAGWTRVHTVSRCKYGVRFTVEDHLKAFLSQTGFTSPVNLIWELIPFSFVVDWFLPIGPWLETLNYTPGLVMLDGYESLFTKRVAESLVRFSGEIGPSAPGQNLQTAGSYRSEQVIFDRTRLNTFPAGRFPAFKNPLSTTHALNALALLRSVFR